MLFDVQDLWTEKQTGITGRVPAPEESSRSGYSQKAKGNRCTPLLLQPSLHMGVPALRKRVWPLQPIPLQRERQGDGAGRELAQHDWLET